MQVPYGNFYKHHANTYLMGTSTVAEIFHKSMDALDAFSSKDYFSLLRGGPEILEVIYGPC
jgi:hypothetical protein